MSGGIGQHRLADFHIDVARQQRTDLAHLRLVGRIGADGGCQRLLGKQRVVGGHQRRVFALAVRVDHGAVEKHVELERRLHECRVARRHDAAEQDGEEREAEQDGGDAIETEASLGRIAVLDRLLDGGARGGAGPGGTGHRPGKRSWNSLDSHYSYCSRYLRTM